jgi:hypothetical protein
MKKICFLFLLSICSVAYSQQTENVIIITTDGFRWQEVFTGMDTAIANNKLYNQKDSANIFKKYWSDDAAIRRKNLLPFFWNTIVSKGQIYGNRQLGNYVNTANPYKFSYPGYSEIMCGFVDTAVNSNSYKANPNTNLLEFFNQQAGFKGKIAAFSSWEAFNRILNEDRSGIPVIAAYDNCGGKNPTPNEKLINAMLQDSHKEWDEECMDVFTHYEALEDLKIRKPKVLYISYGETDEWAHAGKYSYYLDAAHQFDAWIKEIWDFVQSDPQYKNKTTLFITTDHGRGDNQKGRWTSHGKTIENADQIWCAILGPDTPASGEMKSSSQVYQKQFAQTIAKIMGYTYKAEHSVADEITTAIKK